MRSDFPVKSFSLIVLLMILLIGIMTKTYLGQGSSKMTSHIDTVQRLIQSNQWHAALQEGRQLETEWKKSEPVWAIFINHHEIDNITVSLGKSLSYVRNKDRSEATAYLHELKEYISHIPAMESISLKNIL